MSRVLVSPPPMPPLATTPLMEAASIARPSSQLHLNGTACAGDREQGTASMEEKRMASQLSYLASQHHTSEYNRLKFGSRGAPAMYIPLSIQLPAHVSELKARQAQSAHKKVWWPADIPAATRPSDQMDVEPTQNYIQDLTEEPLQQENVMPCSPVLCAAEQELDDTLLHLNKPVPPLNHPPALNLQRELSVAMSSPLSIITIPQLSPQETYQQRNLSMYAKTSESHPINISPIIPFELLPLISSHLVPTPPHAPYMFELPPSLYLNHLTMHSSLPTSESMRPYPMMRMPQSFSNGTGTPAHDSSPSYLGLWPNPVPNGMPEPAVLATNGCTVTQPDYDQNSSNSFYTLANSETTILPGNPSPTEQNSVESLSSRTSLLAETAHDRSRSAPPSLLSSLIVPSEVFANGAAAVPPPLPELVHAMSSDMLSSHEVAVDPRKTVLPHPSAGDVSPSITWALNLAPEFVPVPRPTLGNMLLSSCPGKKVRLSGPVKGRGAICRDLGHDLRRVRALGVGCIICCLDDEELEFLGASWPEYSDVARAVGLDVLRIPTPEGLAPPTPALLDQHLSYIIHSYTLKGVPILVHCRGGVGRAGLVACCWMLKLGLCGWLSPALEVNGHVPVERDSIAVKVRRETVELVERVIAVVRRRRSVKAIETYEQVRFLVEFVEHLKAGGGRVP